VGSACASRFFSSSARSARRFHFDPKISASVAVVAASSNRPLPVDLSEDREWQR